MKTGKRFWGLETDFGDRKGFHTLPICVVLTYYKKVRKFGKNSFAPAGDRTPVSQVRSQDATTELSYIAEGVRKY